MQKHLGAAASTAIGGHMRRSAQAGGLGDVTDQHPYIGYGQKLQGLVVVASSNCFGFCAIFGASCGVRAAMVDR